VVLLVLVASNGMNCVCVCVCFVFANDSLVPLYSLVDDADL
jgi:hypothetical protein